MRHSQMMRRRVRLTLLAGTSAAVLTACETQQPLDFDLRGNLGTFSTAEAATAPLANRPRPDSRGVITYPNYQVAVAQKGDSLGDVAARVGISVGELARYNGIEPDVTLRKDEIIALPASAARSTAPAAARTDISTLAGNAINRAPASPGVQTSTLAPAAPAPVQSGTEPARHRVERGETAYTVARLYNVPVKALAEWNGLGADFAVREGQFLLIPVAQQNPPKRSAPTTASASAAPSPTAVAQPTTTTLPGQGSPTPTPPSAKTPLPDDEPAKPVAEPAPTRTEPVADVGTTTQPAGSGAKMTTPVQGSIIRGYAKGKNEGINIKGADGAPVKAAAAGTVAAITKSGDGIPIVVVRHPDNLLTVYANVTSVGVAKGDSVSRGQQIAKLRSGGDAYVHFEVRNGFESVDPAPYLN